MRINCTGRGGGWKIRTSRNPATSFSRAEFLLPDYVCTLYSAQQEVFGFAGQTTKHLNRFHLRLNRFRVRRPSRRSLSDPPGDVYAFCDWSSSGVTDVHKRQSYVVQHVFSSSTGLEFMQTHKHYLYFGISCASSRLQNIILRLPTVNIFYFCDFKK